VQLGIANKRYWPTAPVPSRSADGLARPTLDGRYERPPVQIIPSCDIRCPKWALDAAIRTFLQEKIAASGKIKGSVEPLVVPTSDRKAILALARDATFDAVIAVLPEQDPNDRLLPPGAGITRKKLPGLDAAPEIFSNNLILLLGRDT